MIRRSPSLNSAILPTNCSAIPACLLDLPDLSEIPANCCRTRISLSLYIISAPRQPVASCIGPAPPKHMPRRSRELGGQRPDFLDADLHHVAGLEKLPPRRAYPGRGAREDQVAGVEGHAVRQTLDLLRKRENHVLGVGILLEDVVHPQFQP